MKAASAATIQPGAIWRDTAGMPIQAHGGGVLYHAGVYYWFGEEKDGPTYHIPGTGLVRVDFRGVACYSSHDLVHWHNEGLVLRAVTDDAGHDLHPSRVVERPKVIYHAPSHHFVLWLHIDDAAYTVARVGVAVSRTPTGPFTYLGSTNPQGMDSRDMTLFQDEDGAAYLICSTEGNQTLRVMQLSDDYRTVLPATPATTARILIGQAREAPTLCKHGGSYHLVTSGCTGWAPNAAGYATATHLLGAWADQGNPCRGPAAATTFQSQGTFILPIASKAGAHLWLADRWNSADLRDSRYVWLPVDFTHATLTLPWRDVWDATLFVQHDSPTHGDDDTSISERDMKEEHNG